MFNIEPLVCTLLVMRWFEDKAQVTGKFGEPLSINAPHRVVYFKQAVSARYRLSHESYFC
jgi:hypothetical protein